MASKKKIVEMITLIKNLFPFYAKDSNVEMLVKTWDVLLNEYPDNLVEVAFLNCLKTAKMPPAPADIIEHINAINETKEESTEELWAIYIKALDETERQMYCFDYTYVPDYPPGNTKTQGQMARDNVERLWTELPDRLKQYLGSKSVLMQNARTFTANDLKFEKNRFDKEMPNIKKREEFSKVAMLLDGGKGFLIGISD